MKECWANLDGLKLRYLESGKGKKQHVLFIHGLGSAADRWMKIPEELSDEFHSVAIDLPGFGESDKPEMNYTIDQFRKTIISFLDKIAVNEPTCIVGHSLGGYIASEIAIEHQKNVEQLVLIDSSGQLQKSTPVLEQYLAAAMNPTPDNVRKAFERMVADPKRIPAPLVDGFIRRINMPNALHAFQSTLQNSATTQIGLERLKKINSIPTLILWGVHDYVIPLEHSEFFKENINDSRLEIIQDAGHAPFAEKPEQVSKLLRDFLI
jgi:pimeloyl-ACP methyl ester carboxylesterase